MLSRLLQQALTRTARRITTSTSVVVLVDNGIPHAYVYGSHAHHEARERAYAELTPRVLDPDKDFLICPSNQPSGVDIILGWLLPEYIAKVGYHVLQRRAITDSLRERVRTLTGA